MSILAIVAAVAASSAALAYLAVGDAKRRRVFGLPPLERKAWQTWLAIAGVLAPAVFLLYGGGGAGFVVWCGAVSVAGWALAATPPAQAAAMGRRVTGGMAAAGRILRTMIRAARGTEDTDDRLDRLERRVAALEAALAHHEPAAKPTAPRRRNGAGGKTEMPQPSGQ